MLEHVMCCMLRVLFSDVMRTLASQIIHHLKFTQSSFRVK